MKKQTVNFAVVTKNGIVKSTGRSSILQPKPNFKGGSIQWYEDKKKSEKQPYNKYFIERMRQLRWKKEHGEEDKKRIIQIVL